MSDFPNPDMATHDRLMGIAAARPQELAVISSEILSSVVCFLMGTVGHQRTAEIMRDWAGLAQRKSLDVVSSPPREGGR